MNKVCLTGRLCKEVELKKTPSNLSVCSFTVACDGKTKGDDGKYKSEFINCVAWRGSAEYLCKYANKGDVVSVEGSLQNRSYDGQNGKVYVTEVLVDNLSVYSTSKKEPSRDITEPLPQTHSEFSNTPSLEISSDDLPFY